MKITSSTPAVLGIKREPLLSQIVEHPQYNIQLLTVTVGLLEWHLKHRSQACCSCWTTAIRDGDVKDYGFLQGRNQKFIAVLPPPPSLSFLSFPHPFFPSSLYPPLWSCPSDLASLPLDIVSDLSCLATFKRLVKTELYNRAYLRWFVTTRT